MSLFLPADLQAVTAELVAQVQDHAQPKCRLLTTIVKQAVLLLYLPASLPVFVCRSAGLQAVIAATAELVAQVQAHQATAARLSSLAVQCGGTALVMDELEALAGGFGLLAECITSITRLFFVRWPMDGCSAVALLW